MKCRSRSRPLSSSSFVYPHSDAVCGKKIFPSSLCGEKKIFMSKVVNHLTVFYEV
jgi:hypothetical protein